MGGRGDGGDIRKGGAGSEVGWEVSRVAADDVVSW